MEKTGSRQWGWKLCQARNYQSWLLKPTSWKSVENKVWLKFLSDSLHP